MPIGRWNKARFVSDSKQLEHWLDGINVVEYEWGSQEVRPLLALRKYKNLESFGEAPLGHILLQDYADEVDYRNIKLLDPNPKQIEL